MGDEVRIAVLGAQGDGVTEDGALFVPGALPGERVRVARLPGAEGPARARLLEVIEPAPERQLARCVHYGACGGCSLQHADDALVAGWKRGLVEEALAARLGPEAAAAVEIRENVTVPAASRRRIALSARRTKKGATLGFRREQSDEIVAVTECPVARPALAEAVPRLQELVRLLASRKGALRLTLVDTPAGVDCAVEGAKPLDGPATALLAGAATRAGLARLSVEGEPVVTRAPPTERLGRAEVVLPPGGFLQPSAEGAATLVALVVEALALETLRPRRKGLARVADLFAGIGTFSLPLAEAADTDAFELEEPALAALDAAWRQAGLPGRVRCERRNLFQRPLVGPELEPYDAVAIDPPRAGARMQSEALARSGVRRIASVSCNPATFARDAKILVDGGYRLRWVAPVDQFRWSPHMEVVAAFWRDD
ncbi:MAG: hypothetical protein AAF160_13020 [Pseudomonadota bacterium]